MSKAYTFTARIEDGRLKVGLRTLQALRAALTHWRRCPVTITVERQHATRSLDQNAYYFGVCLKLISEYTGYPIDELHEWAKARFIPKHVVICDRNGEVKDNIVIGGTTRRLDRLQFSEYVESIRKFAAEELSIDIPDPDPNRCRNKSAAA